MDNSNLEETSVPKIVEFTQSVRDLAPQEKEKLQRQNSRLVTPFCALKAEENARKNWDIFYKRNETRFFKDRHWTTREFEELGLPHQSSEKLKILEVGCGVGNLIFPLIETRSDIFVYACDFSERAVRLVQSNCLYDENKMHAFQADITCADLSKHLKEKVDLVTLVFVLSALHPDKFVTALKNISGVLKDRGTVLVRDYGVHDMTQIRFKPGHKISDNLYMRQDGTRTYFFSTEKMKDVFQEAGFSKLLCSYVNARTVNKKEGIDAPRVFIQAKFSKTIQQS